MRREAPRHLQQWVAKLWGLMLGAIGLLLTACGSNSVGTGPHGEEQLVPFLGGLHHLSQIASTVPTNGDLNPYGVAVIPISSGRLVAGDILF